MNDIGMLLTITIYSIFIMNYLLARFIGLCPFIGVSKNLGDAIGMGLAVIFVMTLASSSTWLVYTYFLDPTTSILGIFTGGKPPNLTFLRTISFILVIAGLVQFVEMVILKNSPALYRALGIYLPLITTNCAVLGVTLVNIEGFPEIGIESKMTFVQSTVQGFMVGVGFTMMLIFMSGIREKLELEGIPKALRGAPIAFIVTGLMSIAFFGFSGLSF